MAEAASTAERDLWAAAGVGQGAVVADIGCGPGAVSVVLARLVGPEGRVVAVDRDPDAIAAARAAAAGAGVDNMDFGVGDAHDTGLAADSVDVAMIRHVLAHNGGREEAIVAHAAALVSPGGCVYLVDIDSSAIRTRPANADVEDLSARYWRWHAEQGNDSSVGLRLGELLSSAGLETVDYQGRYQIASVRPGFRPPAWAARETLVAAGLATADDVERWGSAFASLDRGEVRVTMYVPVFCAFGRRLRGGRVHEEAVGVGGESVTPG
jgi:ubiquinone/menaquinone biosynthesis C-methylase UbiE